MFIILFLQICLGTFSFTILGTILSWPSPALPKILAGEAGIHLATEEISWMVSSMSVGNVVSPLVAARIMDSVGRKHTLIYFNTLPVLSWTLMLNARATWVLYVARFLAGLWYGLVLTVLAVYIGEISEASIRGSLTSITNLMFNVGLLFTFTVGPCVSYNNLILILLLLSIVYWLIFGFMPESPYFYIMKNDITEAYKSLTWLRECDNEYEIKKELDVIIKSVKEEMNNQSSYKDIFTTKGSTKAFILAEFFCICKRMSGNGIIQPFASLTLPKRIYGILDENHCIVIITIIGMLSSVFPVFIADKFKRKTLLFVSCIGCCVTTLIPGCWYYLNTDNNHKNINHVLNFIPFVSLSLHSIMYSFGLDTISAIIKSEMFPTNIKAKSSAINTITLAAISFISNHFYLIIAVKFGMYMNFFIFAVICLIGALITSLYFPETKGKSLQEIQEILNGRKYY